MKSHFRTLLVAHRRMNHATVHDSNALLFYSIDDFLSRTMRLHAGEIGPIDDVEPSENVQDVLDICDREMRSCDKQIIIFQRALRDLRRCSRWSVEAKKKLVVTLRYLITKENEWIDMLFKIALAGLTDVTYNEAHATFSKNFQNRCWAFDQLHSSFGSEVVVKLFEDSTSNSGKATSRLTR
jgi:hypothetical protein